MRMRRDRAEANALRAVLARRIEEATAEALRADGDVAPARLEALARLERMLKMREAAAASDRWRWAVPAVAVATLVAASVLLFARVRSTQVELDLTVSEIGFLVPTVQVLSNAMSVTALGVSGLTAVELPGRRQDASDLLLTPDRAAARPGTVNVNPITVPAGTRVVLRNLDSPRRYELVIGGRVAGLAVAANGPVRIVVPPDVNEARIFAFPRRISLEPDSDEVRLDLMFAEQAGTPGPLWTPLPVQRLTLSRIDQFEGPEQTILREGSTIRSGTVYFEALNGKAQPVRAGEELRFTRSSGEVREWRLGDSGIGLRFRGTVHGMSSGSDDARRSLMPTTLDWLRARHGVTLLWGTTAYVVGAFITVLGWWKRQP